MRQRCSVRGGAPKVLAAATQGCYSWRVSALVSLFPRVLIHAEIPQEFSSPLRDKVPDYRSSIVHREFALGQLPGRSWREIWHFAPHASGKDSKVAMTKFLLSFVLLVLSIPVCAQQPVDYRSRTIYFIVTDRFHPHQPYDPYIDPVYPSATNSENCFETLCSLEEQWRKYWGGDIAGLEEKLGYLEWLGISAIWVTPLMENVRAYEGGTGYGTGYHGYWVQNYDRPNAHFGDWDDVSSLSAQLRAHSMRYIQDITLNDSNPYDNHVHGRLYRSEDADHVFVHSYYNDFDEENGQRYYKHFQHTPQCQDAENKSDADWTYWQLHHCLLADLSGYNQHDPKIADYLVNAGKLWLDHGVQDFRLDAVKFPFPDFISTFTHAMFQHSEELGRPNPYIVGEWSGGGVGDPKSLAFANRYDYFRTNILDFTLSLDLNKFIGGSYEDSGQQLDAIALEDLLRQRIIAFGGRDTWQGIFIDNHDQIRTMVRLDKIGISSENERERRMDLATVLLMTLRGIPIIYYGDEQYLANYDLFELNGYSYNKQTINSSADDPFNRPGMQTWDETTSAFQIIRTLAGLRRRSRAISEGNYTTLYVDPDALVFQRSQGDDCVVVAVNRGDAKTISVHPTCKIAMGDSAGLISAANDANRDNYAETSSNSVTLHLGPISSIVLSSEEPEPENQ
jgi:cyclomaltodextrin glucanotransferase